MVLRMKNFDIFGVHWKIQLLGEGGSRKTNKEERIAWKRGGGAWTVCRFNGETWQERVGGVLGGWYHNAHYELSQNHLTHVLIQPMLLLQTDVF